MGISIIGINEVKQSLEMGKEGGIIEGIEIKDNPEGQDVDAQRGAFNHENRECLHIKGLRQK